MIFIGKTPSGKILKYLKSIERNLELLSIAINHLKKRLKIQVGKIQITINH